MSAATAFGPGVSAATAFGPGVLAAPVQPVRKTAKDRSGGVKKTLDVHHNVRIEQLARAQDTARAKRAEVDALRAEIAVLRAEHAQTHSDAVMDKLLTLQDRQYMLENELRVLEADNDELSYILNTGDILFKYYDIVENGVPAAASGQQLASAATAPAAPPPAAQPLAQQRRGVHVPQKNTSILAWFAGTAPAQQQQQPVEGDCAAAQEPTEQAQPLPTQENKATLIQRYMAVTGQGCPSARASTARGATAAAAVASMDDTSCTCRHCHSSALTVMANEGYMFCNDCQSVEYIVMDHDKPSYKDPPKEISYWAYKRINHFNEWLNQTQARQSTEIPEELYDRILLEIKKQRITNMAELSPAKIKDILKKLKGDARKYYEHIPFIIHRLNGRAMPHFSPELEEQLRSMFRAIQVPFSRAVLQVCPDRKNFLSYAFVLHKMMQLLGLDEYVHIFQLLRSREKLHQQDQIWKLICEELSWEFVPSL